MDLSKYKQNGITGMENLGNTCFLNSCMQIINHTYELNDFLDSDKYKEHLKGDNVNSDAIMGWDELRKVMWSGNGVVSPNKFVHLMHNIAKQKGKELFSGYTQNDMPEFFMFFIDCMHNSISRSIKMKISGNVANITDKLAVDCYKLLQNLYETEYSEILDLYYGIYVNQITDIKGEKSLVLKPESYSILDLPIIEGNNVNSSLYDCFNLFVKPDILDGDNAWFNENTNQKQDVRKNIVFWNFPNVLVIALKRFSPDGQRKLNVKIDFPIDNLDLSRYVLGYNPKTYVYDLFGICNHVGGTNGGHYSAFVKHASNKWIHFNDNIIEIVDDPSKMISSMAYCLFYRKKNT
jgi:ubiquitin carboxyl-terminal hydrolase 8